MYEFPKQKTVPSGQVSNSYRCTVCGTKISFGIYDAQNGRCDECEAARIHTIEVGFMGRVTDTPVTIRKEAGSQLGRLAGVETTRCGECRAVKKFCRCGDSNLYQHREKDWKVR